jgi:hypothetical protein
LARGRRQPAETVLVRWRALTPGHAPLLQPAPPLRREEELEARVSELRGELGASAAAAESLRLELAALRRVEGRVEARHDFGFVVWFVVGATRRRHASCHNEPNKRVGALGLAAPPSQPTKPHAV